MITQQQKREIEFLVEGMTLWIRAKLSIFLGDAILSVGMTEELEYLLYCLDASLQKHLTNKMVVRRIIR